MKCKKIHLAGCEGCQVTYCEEHQVAEIELGAVNVRLDIHALSSLQAVLTEANAKVNFLNQNNGEHKGLMELKTQKLH